MWLTVKSATTSGSRAWSATSAQLSGRGSMVRCTSASNQASVVLPTAERIEGGVPSAICGMNLRLLDGVVDGVGSAGIASTLWVPRTVSRP